MLFWHLYVWCFILFQNSLLAWTLRLSYEEKLDHMKASPGLTENSHKLEKLPTYNMFYVFSAKHLSSSCRVLMPFNTLLYFLCSFQPLWAWAFDTILTIFSSLIQNGRFIGTSDIQQILLEEIFDSLQMNISFWIRYYKRSWIDNEIKWLFYPIYRSNFVTHNSQLIKP